ncbi:MAG TPA: VOC family protein [Candidatus Polarisedimenticolaceae bacterium]|nr:VOC family protein [Candidatus Polarisedimenticolaceae bacterium]
MSRAGAVLYAKDVDRVASFYAGVAGLSLRAEAGHAELHAPGFRLVVVKIPDAIARTISIASPPAPRESTPIKLVFPVASLDEARAAASRLGGAMNAAEKEWRDEGCRVCDGHDPEGNLFQLHEIGRA